MIKFALFGAGRIGMLHGANIAASAPRAELSYVYDTNTAAAAAAAARHGARVATSIEAVLEDPTVDAVLIASSTNTHVELITRAARAGKAVLCEKPIDLDIERVERCGNDLAGIEVPLQIAFNRRFDRGHMAMRNAVRSGDIGPLELLVITSRDPGLPPISYLQTSGGIFRDMTIHDFDLARFMLGPDAIVEVFAAGSVMVESELAALGDVDTVMVVMKAASGALVHINNSRRAIYGYDQRVEAFGARGMLQTDNQRASTLKRHDAKSTDAKEPLLNFFIERYQQSYRDELDDFIEAVVAGRPASVGFADGRSALVLANAALESLRSGKSVRVDLS